MSRIIRSAGPANLVIRSAAPANLVVRSAAPANLVILSVGAKRRSRRIALTLLLAAVSLWPVAAHADVAELDASARAAGNMKPLARSIGDRVFDKEWPAQVTQISAYGFGGHVVVGVRISGVKFHRPLTRVQFRSEVNQLVAQVFARAPQIEEVDVWAAVPIPVPKGAIVSGAYAIPTTRPVFTLAVRRGTIPASARSFWDEEWVREAFKRGR